MTDRWDQIIGWSRPSGTSGSGCDYSSSAQRGSLFEPVSMEFRGPPRSEMWYLASCLSRVVIARESSPARRCRAVRGFVAPARAGRHRCGVRHARWQQAALAGRRDGNVRQRDDGHAHA